jgi:phospholipid transport system substrate-binding protein
VVRSYYLAFWLGVAQALSQTVAAAEDPAARTNALIDAFKQVRKADEGKTLTAEDKQANLATFSLLDTFLDFDRLTSDAIAPHKASLSEEQLQHYKQSFRELIRLVAYPDSGAFLKRAKITVSPPKLNGATASVTMDAKVPAEDIETKVAFTWSKNGETWRVTDVSFDGASLVKDYQNQFGRIIGKEKATGFMALLEKRLTKEQKERQAIP